MPDHRRRSSPRSPTGPDGGSTADADPGRADEHATTASTSTARRSSSGSPAPPPTCSPSTAPTSSHNTRAAAACRASRPRVVHHLAELGRLRPRVAARPDDVERRRSPSRGCPTGSPATLRRLHAGPALPRRLRHVPADRALPRRRRRPRHRRSRPATASTCRPSRGSRPRWPPSRSPRVPCHNDLLAENYLDDGERLWIVDYEYSGNNDPTFELGTPARSSASTTTGSRRCAPPTSARRPGAAGPDAAADDHVRRRLDALGGHPGQDLDDRLRLHGLGRGALGAGRARRSTVPTSRAGWSVRGRAPS